MRILLAATPMSGHLNPVLTAARLLVAAGHEVVVTTGSAFQQKVQACGARFVALPGNADIDFGDVGATFPDRKNHLPGMAQLRFDFEHFFVDTIAAQYAGLQAILATYAADLIMADTLFGGCLPLLLSEHDRPTIAALGVTVLPLHRDDGAPLGPGLLPASDPREIAGYRLIAGQVEEALLGPVQQRVDAILASLGACSLPMPYMDALVALPDIYLQPTAPAFEYPRHDLPSTVHFIGALPPLKSQPPSEAVWAALTGGKRLVLVTQGTVANHDLEQLIGPTVRALADRTDTLVLVATGGRPLSALPANLPANVLAAEFLPFDAIMPHLDLFITNGGYGAVSNALGAGVPIIAAGVTEDKAEVNARIAWSGAGIDLRTDTPSDSDLRDAISRVLDTDSYRKQARALARQFAGYDAASALCLLLEGAVNARDALACAGQASF